MGLGGKVDLKQLEEMDYIRQVKAREEFESSKKQKWFVCTGENTMTPENIEG